MEIKPRHNRKAISCESISVSETTVESWMKWIKELCKGYDQRDIWNMNKSSCFFKSLPAKGLAQKGKKAKGWEKVKAEDYCCIFCKCRWRKIGKPIVIWRSKKLRCFRLARAPNKHTEVSYFDDSKSLMQTEKVLDTLNFQMRKEKKNVILFLDNATVHPTSLIDMYSNIKIVFLPKNTTSRLQLLDPGIIQSFKTKYQKKLMGYVIARVKWWRICVRNCKKHWHSSSYHMGGRCFEGG